MVELVMSTLPRGLGRPRARAGAGRSSGSWACRRGRATAAGAYWPPLPRTVSGPVLCWRLSFPLTAAGQLRIRTGFPLATPAIGGRTSARPRIVSAAHPVNHANGDLLVGLRPVDAERSGDRFDPFRCGLDHLSFRVPAKADLEAAVQAFEERGVQHGGITDLPPFGIAVLPFKDPDGLALELTAPL